MPCINLADLAEQSFGTSLEQLDDRRIYKLLVKLVQERSAACPLNNGKKKLYYISAEFLIGKLLINNMIDLASMPRLKTSSPLPATTSTRLRSLRSNRRWATAAWAVWPRASWIPLPRWALPATVWASITITVCSVSVLPTTSKRPSPMSGLASRTS